MELEFIIHNFILLWSQLKGSSFCFTFCQPSRVPIGEHHSSSWPVPSTITHLQSFLGFANYYRRFIHHYSQIAYPLTSLLRKDAVWNWSPECQKAFDDLKNRFTSAPILRHFDPSLPSTIETDASDFSYGAVLSQRDDPSSPLRPVAFFSKKMSSAEMNYPI